MDAERALALSTEMWDTTILPALSAYIEIPNQSPDFDPEWESNGHMDAAVGVMVEWVKAQKVEGLTLQVLKEPGRTPLIFGIIEASSPTAGGESEKSALLYAHLDKQPPMTEDWAEGLGPYTPVVKEGRLFGRGGADDGYGIFAAITAVKTVQDQGLPHGRMVLLVEASEESSSVDLPHYVETLAGDIGDVDLVVCLDSGASNLDCLWSTTSLRGCVNVELKVSVLDDGVHSGAASGIVPDTFRIARALLNRVEDAESGRVIGDVFYTDIPPLRMEQATRAGEILGSTISDCFPWKAGVVPVVDDPVEKLLNKTWRPTLTVTGADGLPPTASAGNVLRRSTTLKLSVRLPPTVDSAEATAYLRAELTRDPPYGAHVEVTGDHSGSGWEAPPEPAWLLAAMNDASQAFYGNDAGFIGEGWSIPFLKMLNNRYPAAGMICAGVLDGFANAHGPNESFDIAYAKKLSACIGFILAQHAHQ